MLYLYASLFILLNGFWWLTTLVGLPGNWLMVLTAVLATWLAPGGLVIGITVLIVAVVLAAIGEAIELFASAAGSRKAGASIAASAASIIVAIIGGILGTFFIPVPVIGSLIGVCAGAFLGAMGMELLLGEPLVKSLRSGKGAAVGRLWGTLGKLAIGAVIWVVLGVAMVVGL